MNDYNKGYADGFNKFKEVIKQWNENVGLDIEMQIKNWNRGNDGISKTATTPYQFGNKK